MLEQELKAIWKNASTIEQIKFKTSRLLIDLDAKMKRIEKGIKNRDITETAASVFGIIAFSYLAYEIPFILTKIACGLSILWFAYLIYKLKDNKRKKHPIDIALPLREQLQLQKTNMQKEVKLLDTVLYWYVLPPLFANALFIIGFKDPEQYNWAPWIIQKFTDENLLHLLPITLKSKIAYISGAVVFNAFVLWINKRTINKTCKPILNDIENMQQQLDHENQATQ
jgi:hypothetical protein